jgi:hypothetical protein
MPLVAHLSVSSGNELEWLKFTEIFFGHLMPKMDFVRSNPKHLAEALTTETEESCTTYNMLKVIYLFMIINDQIPKSIFLS